MVRLFKKIVPESTEMCRSEGHLVPINVYLPPFNHGNGHHHADTHKQLHVGMLVQSILILSAFISVNGGSLRRKLESIPEDKQDVAKSIGCSVALRCSSVMRLIPIPAVRFHPYGTSGPLFIFGMRSFRAEHLFKSESVGKR